MTDRYTIGQNIAALRKEAGLTQTELADRLHVSHQAISQWERGETLPDILTLPALAEIFGQTAGVLLGTEEKDPVENPAECQNQTNTGGEPVDNGLQAEYRLADLPKDCDYTVVLEKNGIRIREIPADIRKQILIVLEGNCHNLTSAFTTEIRGNVEGNADISGGAHIGEWIGGNTDISGGANIGGSVNGDCSISGGAIINSFITGACAISGGAQINGSVLDGDLTISGQATINGSVSGGDVTTDSPLTIGGNVEGSIEVHKGNNVTVTVQGDVNGDIDCRDLTVGGDVNGDVDCGDLTADGDINGDVDCGSCTVEGDICGDVDCSDCTVGGSVSGDITASGSVQIAGNLEGDIDSAETVQVNGNANGDISAASVKVLGSAPDYDPDDDDDVNVDDIDVNVDVDVDIDDEN